MAAQVAPSTVSVPPVEPDRPVGRREQSLGALFETVLTRGPLSRRDVARLTGLSPASVTKLVRPMIQHGYLIEHHPEAGVPGRPQIPLQVDPTRHFALGIKLMGDELVGVIADLHAEVLSSHRMTYTDTSPAGVVDAVEAMVEVLLDGSPIARDRLLGVGVGVGGHVNGRVGVVVESRFMGPRDVPLRKLLAERLGLPVVIENDVNALAVAEQWFGPGSTFPSFALVTIGAGVGCALVIEGDLWRGASGAAGEFGHLTVDPDGPACHCGRQGCLEAFVGDAALVEAMSTRSGRRVSRVADVVEAAHSGDEDARAVFSFAGRSLGRALTSLLNLLNPPLVILSGEGVAASDLFIDALRAELAEHSFSTTADDCTLMVRPLPDETWARGAAATMLRQGVLLSLRDLTDEVVG